VVFFSEREFVQVFNRLLIYALLLEIQSSRGEGCDPINRFNPAIYLCLSQARTWISNDICRCHFGVQWVQFKRWKSDGSFCWYW